jgi:hypothetical protein
MTLRACVALAAFAFALSSSAPARAQSPAPPAATQLPMASPPPAATTPPAPADAESGLQQARAAYDYGDMELMVAAARAVAEGGLHPTPAQRVSALRYLGIGLFLTERREGAETAFFDLLRLRPGLRLDTTTTRPDVVAFFEEVRRRHAVEIHAADSARPGKSLVLALLPPLGQFQSGHKARGITIAALEALSLAGSIASYLQLRAWDRDYPGHTFGPHADTARTLKVLNVTSIVVFAATFVIGVIDGVASYTADPEETPSSLAHVFTDGYRF